MARTTCKTSLQARCRILTLQKHQGDPKKYSQASRSSHPHHAEASAASLVTTTALGCDVAGPPARRGRGARQAKLHRRLRPADPQRQFGHRQRPRLCGRRAAMVQNVLLPNTYCFRSALWWQPSVVRRRPRRPQAIACLHLASRLALELRSNSALFFLCRPLRWGERVGHQWQRDRTGRNGVYDEPPVRRRSHGHLRDVLLVHRHERERSLRCALRPLSNRVSAAAGLGVGGQGGRGSGCGGG